MRKMFAAAAAAVTITVTALALPSTAIAQRIAPGFNSNSVPANDDRATDAINLGFNANFFGTTYAQTYVSNNGYITFNNGQGFFTPTGLGADYVGQPIIAAFFADVDTRGAGSALTTYGTGTYNGRDAFGVTWNGVGYFNSQDDKLNKFQLILANRADTGAGNFDIYLNYDQILWETGSASGGTAGFGGTSAAVGYNAGKSGNPAGTYYELTGSRTPGSFLDGGPRSLRTGTNNGTPGQYLFEVRNGAVTQPSAVPEPAGWALMIGGIGLVGFALRRRQAARVSYAV